MRTLGHVAILVAACTVAGAALGQGFVGVGIGQSRVDFDCAGTTSCDKTDTAFKIFGGYMATPNIGVEATYFNQGKAKVTGTDPTLGAVAGEWKGDGFGLYARAVAPLDKASLFVKLGIVSAKVKLDARSSVFGSAGTSERHTNAGWGIGAAYDFDKAWSARIEFERARVKFQDEKINVDLVTASAIYRF